MAETKTTEKNEFEREYVIPLRKSLNKVPTYKRANKAVRTIKEFLVRHMKIRDGDLNKVKIDKYLNEFIWSRGIKKPPARIKVKVKREGELIRAELSELSEKLKFKKTKLDRREQKASEVVSKKKIGKTEEEKTPEKTEEEKAEEIKESGEKKAAVVEAGRKMEKAAAKKMKHISGGKEKEPKHPHRMSLRK